MKFEPFRKLKTHETSKIAKINEPLLEFFAFSTIHTEYSLDIFYCPLSYSLRSNFKLLKIKFETLSKIEMSKKFHKSVLFTNKNTVNQKLNVALNKKKTKIIYFLKYSSFFNF